ncbi:uncharacterized protein K460DRAFT_21400 [Cucurbitaria berberidis CBS 394.84]|uniref:GPI anchored protein n=1 Tax=Cucurbitaria berberidis CBS 394.84 TaxID=1168544 RepID=A0A9P4GTG5_9PLEO|nr:uncharacterized protein K460DRAFT_21400 [Cucurbitaria berberidis CBS 394.84]KAF1850751.1 hypothetical protein K460DRAFT_21400 [Cucurbitaria berberidis CBS 394.84]
MASRLVLLSLLGLSIAQTTTLTIPLFEGDAESLDASVVSVSPGATTLQLACPQAHLDCGLFPKHILVFGPSTYNVDMSDPNTDFTATQDCVIAPSSAVCKETAGGSEANFPGSSTTTYEASSNGGLVVTVTAGVEKLKGGAQMTATGGGSSPTASASTGSGASKTTASATQATGSSVASGSASASQSSSTPASASKAAAAANVALGGGLVGAAAGLLGSLLL